MDRVAGGVLIAFSPLVDAAVDAIFSSRLRAYLSIHCLERYKKKACPPSLRGYISFYYLPSSISYLYTLSSHWHCVVASTRTYRHSAEGKHSSFQTTATTTKTTYSLLPTTQHGFQDA